MRKMFTRLQDRLNVQALIVPLTLLGIPVIWQLFVFIFQPPRYLLPSPIRVWDRTLEDWDSILGHSWVTLVEALLGFGAGVAIGVPLAIMIVHSRILASIAFPILVATQAVPKIALAPLLLIWLGFGMTPKVVVAFLISFFPIVVTSAAGLASVGPDMLRLMQSMGASTWTILLKLRFPSAVPEILSGFKVAVSLCVVGAVVGEFIGANEGLGYLILVGVGNFDTPLIYSSIVILTAMGITLFYMVVFAEKRLTKWNETPNELEAIARAAKFTT
jgi:NitT/TauT family transport system permease protein